MQKPKRTRYLYPHVSWRKQSSGCTCIPGRESIHSKSIMETNRQEKKEPVQLIFFFQLPCCCNHSYPIGNSVLHFSLIDNKNKSSNIFTSLDPPNWQDLFLRQLTGGPRFITLPPRTDTRPALTQPTVTFLCGFNKYYEQDAAWAYFACTKTSGNVRIKTRRGHLSRI